MTYLFVIIALSLVNAVSVNVPLFEVLLTNVIMVIAVWLCEMHLKSRPSKLIQYDRIELITPERRPELIADLEKRLGVKVKNVEIGSIDFLQTYLKYDQQALVSQVENRFDRITLVNKAKTERLTIDTNLRFHNIATGQSREMDNLAVIELKRDGLQPSPVLPMLSELRIFPHGFSKYCIGSALTNEALRRNRIKPRLHSVEKMMKK